MRSLATAIALAAATALHAQTLTARLDSTLRAAERAGFSGVVRIDRNGATRLERGYGLANRAEQIAFTPNTVVQIGSNTKDFTAVALLQLVRAGKLSLDDSLGTFFPDAPPAKRGITVRQLMTHRAGFPQGIGGDFEPVGRDSLVARAMRTPLLFAPGTTRSYSNTGYSLLAAIIERVTGTSYDEYVRDAILAPLGLGHTGFLLPHFADRDLAHGYLASGADAGTMLAKAHAPDGPWWNLRGNGGMLSTVDDMMRFYDALFGSDTLLPRTPAARAGFFDPGMPIGLAGSDGVNFFLYERVPALQLTFIVASTSAAMKGPAVRDMLAGVLGLPNRDGGGEPVARRPGGRAASPEIASLVAGLVQAINASDREALRRFVAEHFTDGPGDPSVDERVQRIGGLPEQLGAIAVERVQRFDDGSVEATVRTRSQGAGVLLVEVAPGSPARIRRIGVRIGG